MKIDRAIEILGRNSDLAKRLGYTPEAQRPEVLVAQNTPQARLDELIAAGYRPVTDETFSKMLGELPDPARIEADPITGRREYRGSLHTIRPTGFASMPPQVMEVSRIFGSRYPINRYALRPGSEYVAQAVPASMLDGAEPTFFASGDLPPLTASGCDPSILPWCSWEMRHSAAFSSSAANVLEIIECSAEGLTEPELTNEPGRSALNAYIGRVHTWASSIPPDERELTEAEFGRLYGPGADAGD